MEDVYKIVMDATDSVTQARLLTDAVNNITAGFEKCRVKMIAFSDEGTATKVAIEGVTKTGQQQTVVLQQLETGWTEVSRSFAKVKTTAKEAETGIEQMSTSMRSSIDSIVKKVSSGFSVAQSQVDKFNMASADREIHDFVAKNSNELANFHLMLTNLSHGFMTANGSDAVMQLQSMMLRKGGAIEVRGYGPEADYAAINRIQASQTLSPRRGGPGQVYTGPRDDGPDYDFQSASKPVIDGGVDRKRQYSQMDLEGLGPFNPSNMGPQQSALEKLTKAPDTKPLETLTKAVKDNKEATDGLLLSWQNFGRYMVSHAAYQGVYAIIGALKTAASEAMEFEKAIATIRTIGAGSQADWADSAIKVSNMFGTGATDVAKGYYSALSNQMGESVADIERFTIATQKFAMATNSTAEEANNLFASFINSYGMSVSQVEELQSKLFATIDLGRIVAKDMANTIGRVTAPAAQLGVKAEEVMSALALLTQKGVKPADAMTQLLNLMNKLIKPSKELAKQFNEWGYVGAQAAIQMEGFPAVLKRIADISETKGIAGLAQQFNDLRGFRGVLSLTSDLSNFNSILDNVNNSSERFTTAFEQKFNNAAHSIERQLNGIKNQFIVLGKEAITAIDPILKSIGGLDGAFKTALPALGAFAGAAGIGGLVLAARTLLPLLTKINPYVLALSTLTGGLGVVLGASEDPDKVLRERMKSAKGLTLPDTKDFIADLEKAVKAAEAYNKAQAVGFIGANKNADFYYNKLQQLEESYRDELDKTTRNVADSFDSRIKSATEAVRQATQDLASSQAILDRLSTAINKSNTSDSLIGKKENEQYKLLQDRSASLLTKLPTASRDEQQRIVAELEDNETKMAAIRKAAADYDKTERDVKLRGRKAELEALLDINRQEQKQIDLSNKYSGKDKKTSKESLERSEAAIQKELDAINAKLAAEQLKRIKDQNNAIDDQKKIYADVNTMAKDRVDSLQRAYEIMVETNKLDAENLQKKQKAEERIKAQKDAYSDALKELNKLMAASEKPGYFKDRNQAESDQRKAVNLTESLVELAGLAGIQLTPESLKTFSGVRASFTAGLAGESAMEAKNAAEESRRANTEDREAKLQKATAKRAETKEQVTTFAGQLETLGFTNVENIKLSDIDRLRGDVERRTTSDFGALLRDRSYGMVYGDKLSPDESSNMIRALESMRLALTKDADAKKEVLAATGENKVDLKPGIETLTASIEKLRVAIENMSQGKATGGYAAMGRGSDTIPTMLAPGEFVVNSTSAARWRTQLMAMNNGTHMASGGPISNVNVGDINISMSSQGNAQADVIAIGHALRREIRRGTVKL